MKRMIIWESQLINSLFLILSLGMIAPSTSFSNDIIRTDRPRLLFDDTDLAKVRASLTSYGKADYLALKNFTEKRMSDLPPSQLTRIGYDPKQIAAIAFVALLEGDREITRRAIDYGLIMAQTSSASGDINMQRNRLLCMAYIYDWLHDQLTDSERMIIRNGIIAHIKQLGDLLNNPLYTGGQSRYGTVTIMAGLISLSEQDWPTERAQLLLALQDQWEIGYNPFQSFVEDKGGYHMGWRYGPSYTEPMAYLFWEKATGIQWGSAWRPRQTDWLIYGLRGDETLPRSGDAWDSSIQDDNTTAITAVNAGLFKDKRAEWLYTRYFSNCWEPRRLLRLIFADPSVKPLAPWEGDSPLPLARQFGNSGLVVARDDWGANTTHLVFKSTPFYTRNHHHKDQNSFELSYKGSLLIDSGVYDAFGSSHWKNYYTRSIAHNTLIVFDPNESFVDGVEKVSNDGGQQFPPYDSSPIGREVEKVEEVATEKYKRDGVTGFSTTNGVTWIRGDASKAYNSNKLTSFIRDVLMVNRPEGWSHPFLLVLDQVQLVQSLTPTILFHSNEEPHITKDGFKMVNQHGGLIYGSVLAPSPATITAIGGSGKEWLVNGVNYPPAKKLDGQTVDPGAWRVEIATTRPETKTEFLTFLAVGDSGESVKAPVAQAITTLNFQGAIVGDALYLIFKGKNLKNSWSFKGVEFGHVRELFVGGLPIRRNYQFLLNDKIFTKSNRTVTLVGPDE